MTKKEVQRRVLQRGKPLDLDRFSWDEKTKTFSSSEDNLVLDFNDIEHCTFNTGGSCTFITEGACTFNTGRLCTFDTLGRCTFKTGGLCTFKTGWGCTFNTGWFCTFDTGSDCTFDTGWVCTFKTWSGCAFNTGKNCVVVRRDVYEVIELDGKDNIKLNGFEVKGYEVIREEMTLQEVCEELGRDVKIKE